MNKLSLREGRVNQKLETRAEILRAAQSLMKKKRKINLEDVARKAKVSRATIYRYFSNVDILTAEASLDIHHLTPDELNAKMLSKSLTERISNIQGYYNSLAQEHEIVFRRYISTVLAESITSKKKIRGSRRVESLRKALEPFKAQLSPQDYSNLINISSVLMGIDPLITAKDVCGLNNKETDELLRWGLEMILQSIKLSDIEKK